MSNPTYLPLKEAAQKHNVDEKVLTQLIAAGMIEAMEQNGEIVVAVDKNSTQDDSSQTKEGIIAKEYGYLQDQWITVSKAAQKYKVLGRTIREWVALKYIQYDNTKYPMRVNEAEVAYCTEIHYARKRISGVPLLDTNGLPYQLKHPDLSEYRQRKRHEQGQRKKSSELA